MASPAYNKALSPIKNLQALLRVANVAPIANTTESALTQLAHFFATRLGVHDVAPTVVTTAAAVTYTAASFAAGLIKRDPNGAARADVTPTAAQIIAALSMTQDYQQRIVTLHNNADAAETITLTAGTGVTLKGAITCEQNCVIRLAIVRTSSTTVAIRQI